ncbi:uncharacterized protein V6R79_005834 [Siganus canaliculatus]
MNFQREKPDRLQSEGAAGRRRAGEKDGGHGYDLMPQVSEEPNETNAPADAVSEEQMSGSVYGAKELSVQRGEDGGEYIDNGGNKVNEETIEVRVNRFGAVLELERGVLRHEIHPEQTYRAESTRILT